MNNKKKTKITYLLIKIQPGNAEDVHIMLTLFRGLWKDDCPIITFSSIYGPYDILIKMEGDENVLEQTSFYIREELGNYITYTLTLPILEYTVKAVNLKKRFKEAGTTIPDDLMNLNDNKEIKLDELKNIVTNNTTIANILLKSLRLRAKPIYLNQQIDARLSALENLNK
ncbi:MAG: hypothetical protein E4G94_03675 [ANME-2 cluster archaeon]|nr:MAG: hypothetical protein E4G94_03675 [ANME-2 cluster archaeon]